jgi:hypothetical protein
MHDKVAEFFYQQCTGGYSGHMAEIPHNPQLHAFTNIFCGPVVNRTSFATFLEEMAKALRQKDEVF